MQKHIKFSAVLLVIAGVVILGVAQSHFVKADDSNGNSAVMSQESGSNATEGNSGNILNNSGNENSGESNSNSGGENSQNGPSFTVNATNKVVANGASLVSNSGQSLVIRTFGLNLNLMITSSTSFISTVQVSTSTIADMKTGDVIDLTGQIDPSSGLISVNQIRDETLQQQNAQSIQQQIQTLLQQVKQLEDQLKSQQSGG